MNMQYPIRLMFVICLALLISCDDDDEKKPSIIGQWQGDKAEIGVTTLTFPTPIQTIDDNFDAVIEFKSDGTILLSDNNQSTSGTYEVNGMDLSTNINFDTDLVDLSGDCTIKELTATKLTISIEQETSFPYPGTGLNVPATVKATLFFTRVN